MNIRKEQIDELNVVLFVEIVKDDYTPKVSTVLRDYRRKANMPGFRPGKIPEGLIRKMYGKAVLIDEINKLVSESLQNYITEQQMQIFGEPLPKLSGDDFNWEIGNDFNFEFEAGLQPKVEINLSKEDHITKYQIIIDDETVKGEIDNYAHRYGYYKDNDAVTDFSERLSGDTVQLDSDGQPVENGLSAEDTHFLLSTIKDEERKKPFENAKVGDEIIFNLSETFPNDWEVAMILKKKDKNEVGDISASQFKFTVKNIQKYTNSDFNQEFFDKVFGEGAAASYEEFEDLVRKSVTAQYEEISMSKLLTDIREYLLEKINPQLPEEFLYKWLLAVNKEIDEENIERGFSAFLKGTKWDLITNAIIRQNELNVNDNELLEQAKKIAREQFAMYGLINIPADSINGYAVKYLEEEKNVRNAALQVLENKIAKTLSKIMDLNIQELSMEEFNEKVYGAKTDESAKESEVEEDKAEESGEIEKIEAEEK